MPEPGGGGGGGRPVESPPLVLLVDDEVAIRTICRVNLEAERNVQIEDEPVLAGAGHQRVRPGTDWQRGAAEIKSKAAGVGADVFGSPLVPCLRKSARNGASPSP